MSLTDRLTALKALAAKVEELRNRNADLEAEFRRLDPTESLLYYALDTGAVKVNMEDEVHMEEMVEGETKELGDVYDESSAYSKPEVGENGEKNAENQEEESY